MEVFKYFPHVSANLQFLCLSCEDLFVLACSSVALNTCMAYIYIYTDVMYAEKLLWLVAVKGVALFQALVHESLRIRLSGLIGE